MTFWDAFGASKKAKTGVFGQKTGVFWSLRPEFDMKKDSEMVQNDLKLIGNDSGMLLELEKVEI